MLVFHKRTSFNEYIVSESYILSVKVSDKTERIKNFWNVEIYNFF